MARQPLTDGMKRMRMGETLNSLSKPKPKPKKKSAFSRAVSGWNQTWRKAGAGIADAFKMGDKAPSKPKPTPAPTKKPTRVPSSGYIGKHVDEKEKRIKELEDDKRKRRR